MSIMDAQRKLGRFVSDTWIRARFPRIENYLAYIPSYQSRRVVLEQVRIMVL